MNFPLSDIIFSRPTATNPVDVVQFTWQVSRPFTIRALYDLRVNRLQVSHEVCIKVCIMSPGIEADYARLQENDFLKGSLDKPFEWSKTTAVVEPQDLLTMWNSTQVHVIRPKTSWRTLLRNYMSNVEVEM